MFDVCASGENTFEVDPLPLDVDPNVCKPLQQAQGPARWKTHTKKDVYPVELVLPRARLARC